MKIRLFTEVNSLIDHLLHVKGQLSVLDFTRSDKLRVSVSKEVIYPGEFTYDEKARIVDEYVELISNTGAMNGFSVYWLCHPVSEKNDLAPDNLLSQVVAFISFQRFFSDFQGEVLLILTVSHSLIRNIIAFSHVNNIDCKFVNVRELNTSYFSKRHSLLFNAGLVCTYIVHAYKARLLCYKIDRGKRYSVIRTFFDNRSGSLISQDKDVYFGRLPGLLKNQGENILYFGNVIHADFKQTLKDLANNSRNPILLNNSLLSCLDFLRAWVFKLVCKYAIKFNCEKRILDVDVAVVFKNYFNSQFKNFSIGKNYLYYLGTKKLLKKYEIDRFYNLFENFSWEKLTTLAIKENGEQTGLKAFQHAQVALSSIKFFLGKKEASLSPLPDKIITLGEITRQFMVKRMNYPKESTVVGCALRQEHDSKRHLLTRKKDGHIMVFLWTFERSVEMINFLYASRILQEKYCVVISTHPNHPIEKLIPYLNFEYKEDFNISPELLKSNESLEMNFENAAIVVYSGTTVCMDAISSGLPVINVEFNDFLSSDPLFCFNDFKWVVKKPDELLPTIETINELTDDVYYARQKKAKEFAQKYLYPVTDENLVPFIDGGTCD
jgi:hypothetical protein